MNSLAKDPLACCARLAKVGTHLDQNLDRPIHLPEAARMAALETKYFSEFVFMNTGWHWRDVLAYRRVSRAVVLLRDGRLSITEIAYRIGYESLGTFERAFKRYLRRTPREFRLSPHVLDVVLEVRRSIEARDRKREEDRDSKA